MERKKEKTATRAEEDPSLGKKKDSTLFFISVQQAKAKNKRLLQHMHVSGRNKLSLAEWTLRVQNQREIKVSCTVVTPCWGERCLISAHHRKVSETKGVEIVTSDHPKAR